MPPLPEHHTCALLGRAALSHAGLRTHPQPHLYTHPEPCCARGRAQSHFSLHTPPAVAHSPTQLETTLFTHPETPNTFTLPQLGAYLGLSTRQLGTGGLTCLIENLYLLTILNVRVKEDSSGKREVTCHTEH